MSDKKVYVFPIGSENLLFRRTTNRYGRKGSFSANRGFLRVKRDVKTGWFASLNG